MKTRIILFFSVYLIFSFELNAQHDPFQETISVYAADSILKIHDTLDHSIIIIDLRTEGEYASGYIEGARNLNYYGSGFDDSLAQIDKNKEYLIYCASGGRSGSAFNKMKALNFKMVYNMQGGINAWKAAGYPVVTGTGLDVIVSRPAVVKIYPNPVTGESKYILADGSTESLRIKVFSITGSILEDFILRPGGYYRPDLNKLENGVYFYRVYLNNEVIQTERFIKNR